MDGSPPSEQTFSYNPDTGKVQICNVYVIGSMGSGKSTLLNWLHDFGQTELFRTARSPTGVTTSVQLETLDRQVPETGITARIRLHDTPGLNEVDLDDDTANTNSVLKCLCGEGVVSCVFLCVNSWRLDTQAINTIDYYSKVFRPLFIKGNVVLLRTNISDEDYFEMTSSKSSGSVKEFKDLFRRDLLEQVSNTGNISFVELINSKLHPRNSNQYLDLFASYDAGLARPDSQDDVWIHSYKVRERILDYVIKCGATDMTKHSFPLPPQLEAKRIAQLEMYRAVQEAEIKATEKYNEGHAKLLSQMVKKQRIYGDLVLRVNQLETQIQELRQPIVVDKTTASGDDWVKFTNEKVNLMSRNPFTIPKSKWRLHHCEVEMGKCNGTDVEITIKPWVFLLHLENSNGKSWYTDIWLECDGSQVNCEQIAHKEGVLSECIGSRTHAYEDLLEATNEVECIKTDLDRRHEVDKKLRAAVLLLSKETFTQKDLPSTIAVLSTREISDLSEIDVVLPQQNDSAQKRPSRELHL